MIHCIVRTVFSIAFPVYLSQPSEPLFFHLPQDKKSTFFPWRGKRRKEIPPFSPLPILKALFTVPPSRIHTYTHGKGGGGGGGIPPSEDQKPTPYPKAKNWLPSKKIFDSSPPLRQKIRHFWQSFTKKVPKWGKKAQKFWCGPQLWRRVFFVPLLPPDVTPNFTPPLRAILRGTSLFEAFFPLWKKVGAHVCLQ